MHVIPGDSAYASLRQNKAFRWTYHQPKEPLGQSRTRADVLLPLVIPKFKLHLRDRVFTIGSCFARHVESFLEKYGYRFPTRDPSLYLPQDECTSMNGFFNKFTTHSMLNELSWAFGASQFSDAGYFQDGSGRWYDGQLPANFASKERAIEVRDRVIRVTREVAQSDVLILTLGLVEAWHDAESGHYLNTAPPASAIKAFPGRFSVHILDYSENMACMEHLYEIVKAANPSLKIIVTVSPVPLSTTFSGQDISVANMYSKSTLRAVAGDFTHRHADVQYFPSYEAVIESDGLYAWTEDAVHVRGDMVACVITHFLRNYLQETEAAGIDPSIPRQRLREVVAASSALVT